MTGGQGGKYDWYRELLTVEFWARKWDKAVLDDGQTILLQLSDGKRALLGDGKMQC